MNIQITGRMERAWKIAATTMPVYTGGPVRLWAGVLWSTQGKDAAVWDWKRRMSEAGR